MKSAISIELDGTTFALDERAYHALRSYLDRAAERLGAHPDRAEVIAGLERSIAAKLRLRAQDAAPIDETTMLAALKQVGRVDGPALDGVAQQGTGRGDGERRPRRLYRLREGHLLAGVCTGIAAYAAVDVNVVRILFIVAAVISGGTVALIYGVLAFVMPMALTDGEIADAHGGTPRQ
jgi:phage shock protein PspC (stress-responsive transcriptional regulator)